MVNALQKYREASGVTQLDIELCSVIALGHFYYLDKIIFCPIFALFSDMFINFFQNWLLKLQLAEEEQNENEINSTLRFTQIRNSSIRFQYTYTLL